MAGSDNPALSTLEYHVLLALSAGPLHGYAVKEAIANESGGALEPRAGSMYRVIARLMTAGYVSETNPVGEPETHPGHPRRYYMLSGLGRQTLAAEARRLAGAAAMAARRLGAAEGRS